MFIVLSMPSNKQEYLSDALFSETEHPSRVFIMLVQTRDILIKEFLNIFYTKCKE